MARDAVSDNRTRGAGRLAKTRLAVLLIGVTVLGAWLTVEMVRAHQQRAAIEAIWRLGGYVQREHERAGASPLTPRWYRNVFGDDFMNPVVVARLAASETADEDLISVGKLTHLRMLDLRDTRITDDGLTHLRGLRRIEILVLTGTNLSDRGLEHLTGMTGLKVLCLEETGITDRGLRLLKEFPYLGWLNVCATRITDAGLTQLRDCPRLEVLSLERCPISENEIEEFQRAAPHVDVYAGGRRRPAFHYFYRKHFFEDEPSAVEDSY
jgi:hypothetical protein